jgi:hypothetical protein
MAITTTNTSPEGEKGAHISPRDLGKRGRGKMLFLA